MQFLADEMAVEYISRVHDMEKNNKLGHALHAHERVLARNQTRYETRRMAEGRKQMGEASTRQHLNREKTT